MLKCSNVSYAERSDAVVRLSQFDVKLPDRRKLCREFE